jgi:hypothetical protein
MATDDPPKLPRVTLRDEKLYVEGEKEPYFRDREHTIWLSVGALTIYRGYVPEHLRKPAEAKELTEFLYGIAKPERGRLGDRLAVVGLEIDPTTPIKFWLRPIERADTEKYHWPAIISFHAKDWEFPNWDEEFLIEGHCPRQYLDDVLAAVRRGHVDNILVGIQSALWTKDKTTWHVAPPDNHEYGNIISSLTWEEKFGLHPAKEPKDELTPPKEADDESKPQLVELPARLYSMLSALLAIAAALLVLTILRY